MDCGALELNDEAAIAILMISEDGMAEKVREELTQDDFQTPVGRNFFQASCALLDENKKPNIYEISKKLKEMGVTATNNDWREVAFYPAFAESLPEYIRRIKDRSMARRMREMLMEAKVMLLTPKDKVLIRCKENWLATRTFVQEALEKQYQDVPSGLITAENAAQIFAEYRSKFEEGDTVPYVKTGFSGLDAAMCGGMQGGGVYILAARPGVGKTAMAVAVADRVLRSGVRVLFISLEMTINQVQARHIALRTHIPTDRLLFKKLNDEEEKKLESALEDLKKSGIRYNADPQNGGPDSLKVSDIKYLAKESRCGLVIIDYLQLLNAEKGNNQYEQITDICKKLKRTATDLHIPILCLSQLNRQVSGYDEPTEASLRDSGYIEQTADAILMLYRPEKNEKGKTVTLRCYVAKSRFGKAEGRYDFVYDPEINVITDAATNRGKTGTERNTNGQEQ